MKREFLKGFELSDEVIDAIMKENGNDINKAKADVEKLNSELEQTKGELEKAQGTLEKFKDYDNVKADVEKYKTDFENSKAEYEKKISAMELQNRVKEFTSGKKFVNDLTKEAINNQLIQSLNDESNKGKSLDDLLNGIVDGKENIFAEENKPTAPTVSATMQGNDAESGVLSAFRRLNPNIKL